MKRWLGIAAAGMFAAGCAQMESMMKSPEAKVETTAAANPNVPQGTPIWKQGLADLGEASPLAPHAPKLTVPPAADMPVSRLNVPAGLHVEVCASGMPGARKMA